MTSIETLQAQIAALQKENAELKSNSKKDPSSSSADLPIKHIEDFCGKTPLVHLRRIPGQEHDADHNNNIFLVKLEGNNPGGSVKDRPAFSMIQNAERRGELPKNDEKLRARTYILEATSGNTGIGLAMAAAVMGYKCRLVMPENQSEERKATMRAYGAELILTPKKIAMEGARDLAAEMVAEAKKKEEAGDETADRYVWLNQFSNEDNPLAHYQTTGPEIWDDTNGKVTHFVTAAGTHGTAMGVSRYLKEKNEKIQIIKCEPTEGSAIPGIRKWPKEYLPEIFKPDEVDDVQQVSQADAESMMKRLAKEEGIFAGPSSGGALTVALRLAKNLKNAVIVSIVCDRGVIYLSTGVFSDDKVEKKE